jgi:hypothetical protein
MLIIAAAIAINLNLGHLFQRAAQTAGTIQECHVRVVSHKFVGEPGTPFKYDGEMYVMPRSGSIELIASKGTTAYEYNGRKLPLNVFPLDQFGAETVRIPQLFTTDAR